MVEAGKTRRGGVLDLLAEGVELHAADAALSRAIGVVTGAPAWMLGSLRGNLKSAAYYYFLMEELKARASDILSTTDPHRRVDLVWEAARAAKRRYRELAERGPEAVAEVGRRVLSRIRELAAEVREMLAPAREVLEIISGVLGR